MKHLHTLIVFLLTTSLYAQTSEAIYSHVDISGSSMAIHGNELFFPTDTHILKIDLTQTDPSAVEVVEYSASDLLFHGNELYFVSSSSTISKIDITEQNPIVVDVTSEVENPSYMAFKGDDLYISSVTFENNIDLADIFKIDVTDSEATATHVFDGPGSVLRGLAFYDNGNMLYFISGNGFDNHSILKIDISQPSPTSSEVISGLASEPRNIAFHGNDLYMSFSGGVSKIDVTDNSPALTEVVSLNTSPDKLIIEGEHLYIATNDSENEIGHILRYTDSTLSFSSIDTQTPALYPNPAKEELYLLGTNAPQPFRIYNLLGTEIAKGSVSENTPIDIRAFTKGLYLVRLENGQTLKFIKP